MAEVTRPALLTFLVLGVALHAAAEVASVGGYMQGGFEKIAPIVDAVLAEQVTRLKAYVETGTPAAK